MSIIKPRTRGKQFVSYRVRLDRENHETLHAYATFIGEDAEYVLNAVIDTVLAKDKEFAAWRADHVQSFVPPPSPGPKRIRQRGRGLGGTALTAGTDAVRVETRPRTV
jgi:hypothetical protein